jgi:hypothetical protein
MPGRPDRSGSLDGSREGELTINLVAGTRHGCVGGCIAVINDCGEREAEEGFTFVWKPQQDPPASRRFIFHVAPGEKQVVLWTSIPFGVRVYSVHVDPDASLRIDADELPKHVPIACRVVDADGFPIPYFVVTATYQTGVRIRSSSPAAPIMEEISRPPLEMLHPALAVDVNRYALFPDGRQVDHYVWSDPRGEFVVYGTEGEQTGPDVTVEVGEHRSRAQAVPGQLNVFVVPIPAPRTGIGLEERYRFVNNLLWRLFEHRADIKEDLISWLRRHRDDPAYAMARGALDRAIEAFPVMLDHYAWLAQAQDALGADHFWIDSTPLEDFAKVFELTLGSLSKGLDMIDLGDLKNAADLLDEESYPDRAEAERDFIERQQEWRQVYGDSP